MNKFLYSILMMSLTLAAACGTGSGTITTTMSGSRSSVAAAPSFVAMAQGNNGGNTADSFVTGAVSAVRLQVERIVAHRTLSGGATDAEGSEKDGQNGWEVLSGAKEIDLLKAAKDANAAVLGTTDLQEGDYTQIRLYLKDAGNVIVVNGVDKPITVPSGALKLVGNATVAADKKYTLAIKFDLDKSLVVNSQGFKLKPTVKYTLTEK